MTVLPDGYVAPTPRPIQTPEPPHGGRGPTPPSSGESDGDGDGSTGYHIELDIPYDRDIPRDRAGRILNFLLTSAAIIVLPPAFGNLIGAVVEPEMGVIPMKVGLAAGIIAAAILYRRAANRLLIYGSEWNAYMTQNAFSGGVVAYGPGLHLSHWWEKRNKDGNYSLRAITKQFSVGVQTKTARLGAAGVLQYAADHTNLGNFVGVDASTVENGITAFIQSFLTSELAEVDGEQARGMVSKLNRDLSRRFMGTSRLFPVSRRRADGEVHTQAVLTGAVTDFERQYGIKVVSVVIEELKFSDAVQKSRDAIDEGMIQFQIIAGMEGISVEELKRRRESGAISDERWERLLNRAMALSENAKLEIRSFEGSLKGAQAGVLDGLTGGRRDQD